MALFWCAPLSLPPPIDNTTNAFARNTICVRLPEIVQRIINENPDFPSEVVHRLQQLKSSLPDGRIEPIQDSGSDCDEWREYTASELGKTWLQCTFLFAEGYFYRRILQLTQYFDAGAPTYRRDPYALQKRQGLEAHRPAMEPTAQRVLQTCDRMRHQSTASRAVERDAVAAAVVASLWGNKADLSLWPVAGSGAAVEAHAAGSDEHILVSNLDEFLDALHCVRDGTIDILVDNAGAELFSDLCLATVLLSCGRVDCVRLCVKGYPVFVSDVVEADVHHTIDFTAEQGDACRALAGQWRDALTRGRLMLVPHRFYATTLPFWHTPPALAQQHERAAVVIVKGDANYRRLLGDRAWPSDTPAARVWAYWPTAVLALRTLKSEVAVGMAPGQAAAMQARDPQWMVNGKYGLIQFYGGPFAATSQARP